MPKIKLSKVEQSIIKGIVSGQLKSLEERLKFWIRLDKYDRDRFNKETENSLKNEIETLNQILEKMD